MINKEKEWDFMDDAIQIEEILTEANAHNLRSQVMATAHQFIKDDPELDKLSAFQMSYIEWINHE
jgi:hypothetical protein|tara:strand:+ start:590 stop:784 length:195 start_codon:yes stop_codon:yes gene_type:complete